jgi:5'-3' exonuclease
MGIKGLNRFIRETCKKSTKLTHLSTLIGKKIAVDVSIYMYKYESEGALLENMYRMISIFRYYGIIPLFVFDGKPPLEKRAVLQDRKQKKIDAETRYKEIETELLSCKETGQHNESQYELLSQLKKQCVYLSREKIYKVKDLIDTMGCCYAEAIGEADELCAYLVMHCGFWACLSDDTDMFVYGCHRVLRYMSLMNHTVICYDMNGILDELKMTQREFRQVCVLAGTDYSSVVRSLQDAVEYFSQYVFVVGEDIETRATCLDFYEWLQCINSVGSDEIRKLEIIIEQFDFEKKDCFMLSLPLYKENTEDLALKKVRKTMLKYLLMDEGFLFYIDDGNLQTC